MCRERLTIRSAGIEDADEIFSFQTRNGLPALPPKTFRDFWSSCPFRGDFIDVPLAWLLEAEQQVVGLLCNVHMLYDFGGKKLKAGIAAGWLVEPEYRKASLQLMGRFFQQKGLDLWLNDTANATAAKILTAFKVDRIPAPDYDEPLLWPVRTRAFAGAALCRRGIPAPTMLALPLAAALRTISWFHGRNTMRPKQVHRVDHFDERFDLFWNRTRSSRVCLRAVRTSSTLQWRFQIDLAHGSATILVHGADDLKGYVVLVRNFREQLRLSVCEIADLQVIDDDPVVLKELLIAALHAAREQGADALKFAGAQGPKRTAALLLHPYSYRISGWQLFYRVRSSEIGAGLQSPELWDFSPFEAF